MDLGGNTILITGGASGIGLALAERFLQAGSEVIVCGRREEKLREAKARHPRLAIRVCDLAEPREREALFRWAVAEFPRLNVLVNNAGIQRRVQLASPEEWQAALRSFTLSLRHQLASTPIGVVEIVPPAVNTDLGGPGLHTFGVPVEEFADAVMTRLRERDLEIPYGSSIQASRASREELDALFARMNPKNAA